MARLARTLGVEVGEVLDLVVSGQLPPTGPGGLWWPDRSELDPWLVEMVNREVR